MVAVTVAGAAWPAFNAAAETIVFDRAALAPQQLKGLSSQPNTLPKPVTDSYICFTFRNTAMEADYGMAITAMVVMGALLTAGVVFVLSRPSDLGPTRK